MRGWARRTSELHGELAAIAELEIALAWWMLAGGAAAAEPLRPRAEYVSADAAPSNDTFIGLPSPATNDPIRDAIARAHAARAAIRALDGELPEQRLAVTIRSANGAGARTVTSALDTAAFAIGDRCIIARLAESVTDEEPLARRLADPHAVDDSDAPFVCVSIGDEPIDSARHGHRRAWRDGAGPWLGLGRSGELAVVSTCHLVVDGYGHAWLASQISEHLARLLPHAPRSTSVVVPPLREVADRLPLGVAWRELPMPSPRALPLAYALGRLLHDRVAEPRARFSPTFQLPIARGDRDDPLRRRRRVVASTMSVRFAGDEPEPFEVFEARAREILEREAAGRGLVSRLLAAARAMPLSLAWKRGAMSTARPRWLDRLAEVIGGRACLSRIATEFPLGPACAVSSPARLASASDPFGGFVVTVLDDGARASITVCGSGLAGTHAGAARLLDELIRRSYGQLSTAPTGAANAPGSNWSR